MSVALLVAVAGCSGSALIGPDNQLQVANDTDNFAFQVSNLSGVTQTLTYTWSNTGTQASIDLSNAVAGGSGTLTVSDADGTEVYSVALSGSGSGSSSVGAGGDWTIVVELSNVSGTLNFRVQKLGQA